MSFNKVIGQSRAKEIIQRALAHLRVPHAYLFNGPEGVGKEAMAVEFAKVIFCSSTSDRPCDECSSCKRVANFSHPDFIFLFPIPKSASIEEEREILAGMAKDPYARPSPWAAPSIGIDRIRELRRVSTLKPLEGYRVVVIAEAEKMTPEAGNSLLKMLEEPPPSMHLVLTTSRANALLPTIISRCQEVRFGLPTDDEIALALQERKNLTPEEAKLVASISQGNYRRALAWLDESLQDRRKLVVDFLRQCLKDEANHAEWVESVTHNYEKRELYDLLSLVLIWFRDAMFLHMQRNADALVEGNLVNVDQSDTLIKFIAAFEKIHYEEVFKQIENAIALIDGNVAINLILVVLMARLKRCLIIKGVKS